MGSSLSTSPFRSTRLRRLGALTALTLGLPALAACGEQTPVTTAPEPSSSVTQEPSASPEDDGQASSDPTWIAEGEGAAWWVLPSSAQGWEVTAWEDEGVNQLQRDDGCQITSQQNLLDTDASDREESDAWPEAAVDTYERAGFTDITYTTSDDSTSVRAEGTSEHVELVRMEVSYTGTDGVSYTGVRWFRAFTQIDVPVILQLSYFCPTDAYDGAALDTLLEDIAIGNPDPLDMDE